MVSRRQRPDDPAGILVVDKPAGPTSFGVVKAVRRALGVRKVGHTGTLDPLATGVLPLCLGDATKIAALLLADDKTYTGTARLGLETDTLDISGERLREADASAVNRQAIAQALAALEGEGEQRPPAFSAVRSEGQRAYQRARKGETFELAPRPIRIDRFELLDYRPPEFDFRVACSKGTYVRVLVSDVGRALGCGAALTALRRLRSGAFVIEQALPLDLITGPGGPPAELPLLSIDQALSHLPALELTEAEAERLCQGQPVLAAAPAGPLRLRSAGTLVALGSRRDDKVWPTRVFRRGMRK